jgi:uncharacterized protein (DUF1778 family)
MAKRTASTKKVKRLTIRLSAEERRAVEKAAADEHVPASTWARQMVLRRVEEARLALERREERRRSGRELVAMLRSLPDESAHADEVERARREGWMRSSEQTQVAT